jgi:uncharacterized membrane protein
MRELTASGRVDPRMRRPPNGPAGPAATGHRGAAAPGALRAAAGLALTGVAVQLVHPRTQGADRDAATVAVVVLLAAAAVASAWGAAGPRVAGRVALVLGGGGLLVEAVGVATGVPFGDYAYAAGRLGPAVADVPLVIPLAWLMLGLPALVVARRITADRRAGPVVGALALTAWDLYLDPQMVAAGYWTWTGGGPHLLDAIPVSNYLAWFATSWLMMAALWPVADRLAGPGRDVRVPVAVYVWTWVGSAVAHAAYYDLPRSAVWGGLGMGLVVAALARAALRDRAAADA